MIINKREPSVKKSVRLPMSCAALIDELAELNGVSFTDALVQVLDVGLDQDRKSVV